MMDYVGLVKLALIAFFVVPIIVISTAFVCMAVALQKEDAYGKH